MKKSRKLLRKLLALYRDEITKRPFTKKCSQIVDCCTFIIEELNEQN